MNTTRSATGIDWIHHVSCTRRWAALLVAFSLVACDGGDGGDDIDGRDAGPDAGSTAVFDAGPDEPVCEGTAEPCADRTAEECDMVRGCSTGGRCSGFGPTCGQPTRAECLAVPGCRWEMDLYCTGMPRGCGTYSTSWECQGAGCDWVPGTTCGGSPAACSSLGVSECDATPGCRRVSDDVDAGASDGGAADGGACEPASGDECRPYFDEDCGCGYSPDATEWRCGLAGTTPEGGTCDDYGQCAAGLFCLQGSGSLVGSCHRRCQSDGDCATGEACALVGDVLGSFGCTGVCLPTSECSFTAQDCPSGEGCYLMTADGGEYSFCHPEGSGEVGSFCFEPGNPLSCAPGLFCAQDPVRSFVKKCQNECATDDDCEVLAECTGMTAGYQHCR
ncbi:MAG TPA: hypothetical protein RMH99_18635 [Sandaracinaceae bacterium LLY-WYZ-13_1]|nr:hypothetical protein [Sandaracinaceae bacterium LLY-WYZ-13_1]